MICHSRKFIFTHVPKTGGNSVKQVLSLKGHNHDPLSFDRKKAPSYFTFAFVRNPWDRYNSAFWYLQSGGMGPPTGQDQTFKRNHIKDMTFKQFTHKWKNQHPPIIHFHPQVEFIDSDIDYIGRVENFQQDFNIICDKIGISREQLPHKNKSTHKHYTDYYDDETKQIVAEKYAKDIEKFGYKFGE